MKKVTGIVILLTVVLVSAYDVFAYMKGGTEATVSHMILIWSYNYPAFTFAFGFLCGHFFWRTKDTPETKILVKDIMANKEQNGNK